MGESLGDVIKLLLRVCKEKIQYCVLAVTNLKFRTNTAIHLGVFIVAGAFCFLGAQLMMKHYKISRGHLKNQ